MARVAFHTLGCKLNQAETSAIAGEFRRNGFDVVDFGTASEVTVINSCTVTTNADRECRQIVRRALRANPDSFVIVTGCYAQLKPEEIAGIDGVDAVLGSAEKFRIFDLLDPFEKRSEAEVRCGDIAETTGFGPAFSSADDARTRAFLKVQDGCDYTCSFCTIPRARGASRSQSIDDTLAQARELVEAGYEEIVLTGVNTGDFGRARGESLYELLVRLHDVDGVRRLKISSIEPNLLEDRIIELAARSDRMLPHFHVPLQSGSDEILGRMRRRYRSEHYRDRVESILRHLPEAAVGVDVIVGFPGESDTHFERTREFLADLPIAYLHVFTYSERDNTSAAESTAVVAMDVRRQRTRALRALSDRHRAAFARRFAGSVRPVLFESMHADGTIQGYSDNYIRVAARGVGEHTILPVRIGEFDGEVCAAEVVAGPQVS